MPAVETKPVEDSVTKVNGEIAVGEDLDFQRGWWRFERAVWVLFTILIILDAIGCFGRGPVANHRIQTGDGSMDLKYERIERLGTSSMLTIQFGQAALQDGKIQLWISESLAKQLGSQHVIPAPATTSIGGGGLLYTFPASTTPFAIQFELRPTKLGFSDLSMHIVGGGEINTRVFVMP